MRRCGLARGLLSSLKTLRQWQRPSFQMDWNLGKVLACDFGIGAFKLNCAWKVHYRQLVNDVQYVPSRVTIEHNEPFTSEFCTELAADITLDIWDTNYNSDNWEPEFMIISVPWHLTVTLDRQHLQLAYICISLPYAEFVKLQIGETLIKCSIHAHLL